jgi:hypothetical protein
MKPMLSKKDKKIKKKLYLQQISARESASHSSSGGGSQPKIIEDHYVINIVCKCGYEGTVTYEKMDYKLLGKDWKGFIYFLCPSCERHLKYDPINGKIRIRKGVLGFFGIFS